MYKRIDQDEMMYNRIDQDEILIRVNGTGQPFKTWAVVDLVQSHNNPSNMKYILKTQNRLLVP